MRQPSKKTKEENSKNKFYESCCVPNCPNMNLEMHHPLSYGGNNKQIDDIVVPLCVPHHRGNMGDITQKGKLWGELWAITMNRETLTKDYPKRDWIKRKHEIEYFLKNTL